MTADAVAPRAGKKLRNISIDTSVMNAPAAAGLNYIEADDWVAILTHKNA